QKIRSFHVFHLLLSASVCKVSLTVIFNLFCSHLGEALHNFFGCAAKGRKHLRFDICFSMPDKTGKVGRNVLPFEPLRNPHKRVVQPKAHANNALESLGMSREICLLGTKGENALLDNGTS